MSNDERMTKYERRPASLQNPISMAINRRAVQFPWRAHAANSQFVIRHSGFLGHSSFTSRCFLSRVRFFSTRFAPGFSLGTGLLQALLQNGNQIDHLGWLRCFPWLLFDLLSARLNLFLDHFYERFAIVILILLRIPLRTHAIDERLGHRHFALSNFDLLRNMQFARVGQFVSKV